MAEKNFSIVYHAANAYRNKGNVDTYDEAVVVFGSVEAGKSKFIIDNNSKVAVRAAGFADQVSRMKSHYDVEVNAKKGGETQKHEVFYHKDGTVHHKAYDDKDQALSAAEAVEDGLSWVVVNSKDGSIWRVSGFPDRIDWLRKYVVGQAVN
jgi:hypothetical protein